MRLNKKAALNLSVQAIVILVIAFVVLGLALTLTRYIFGMAQEKAGSAIDVIEFEQKPTYDNPITIPKTVNIGSGKTKQLDIGIYNTGGATYDEATLRIKRCISTVPIGDTQKIDVEEAGFTLPSISAIDQPIEASQAAGFRSYLSNDLPAGNYICVIAVHKLDLFDDVNEYDTKQFSLIVTA